MIEHVTRSQNEAAKMSHETLTTPFLYLSSAAAGWEGLVAQAFYEPAELEGWITPAASDISLILFAGGAMRIEQRYPDGPWQATSIHREDLILRTGVDSPAEVRWTSLSTTPTRTLHLHLSKNLLIRTADEVGSHSASALSLRGRSGFQDPLLTQVGLALWHELEQQSPAGKLYAQTAAQLLAVHLLRHYTSAKGECKEPAQNLTRRQIKQVVDFVRAHLSQDLSLEELAQQAGFSPYHFARLFRQTTGESPHQFVLRQRVEKAQKLLQETDESLAHIALKSGFANQSHLTRIFKRQLGLTPRAYRREEQE